MPVPSRVGRVLTRKVNTDAWTDDGPVFLPPTLAEKLISDQPPDYKESRSYAGPDSRRISVITGDNNVGAVCLRTQDGAVVHRLLARRAGTTTPHTVRLSIQPVAHPTTPDTPGGPTAEPSRGD
jgi:hypothetical protein